MINDVVLEGIIVRTWQFADDVLPRPGPAYEDTLRHPKFQY